MKIVLASSLSGTLGHVKTYTMFVREVTLLDIICYLTHSVVLP